MQVVYLPGGHLPDQAIVQCLSSMGVDICSNLSTSIDKSCAIVDASSQSPEMLRAQLQKFGADRVWILLSSHAVFPQTVRHRPWSASDLDPCRVGLAPIGQVANLVATERELMYGARDRWHILRLPIVDNPLSPPLRLWSAVVRILNGNPVVLPDDGEAFRSVVSVPDLADAIYRVLSAIKINCGILHVSGPGLLSPEGEALMAMDGLGTRVPVLTVPGDAWRASGLPMPWYDVPATAFLETSEKLYEIGWTPRTLLHNTMNAAVHLRENALPQHFVEARYFERLLVADSELSGIDEEKQRTSNGNSGYWILQVNPGFPDSIRLLRPAAPSLPTPILRPRLIWLDDVVQRVTEFGPSKSLISPGQCAILEMLDPGNSGLSMGYYIPAPLRPCSQTGCSFCNGDVAITGVDTDGYASGLVHTPGSHLIPISPDQFLAGLFSTTLGRILAVAHNLPKTAGSGLVYGTHPIAMLCGWWLQDQGFKVHYALREGMKPIKTPDQQDVIPLAQILNRVQSETQPKFDIVANFSGGREGELALVSIMGEGGTFLSLPGGTCMETALKIPDSCTRLIQEEALAMLIRWSFTRPLKYMISSAVKPEFANEWALSKPFCAVPIEGIDP